jgi:hypothetical protein
MLRRLNKIPGIIFTADDLARRPSLPLGLLLEEASLHQLLAILEWVVAEILAS